MDLLVLITTAIFKICCSKLTINSLCSICSYSLTYNLRFALFVVVGHNSGASTRGTIGSLWCNTCVMHIAPQNSVTAPMISVVQATKIIITTITIITTTIILAGIRCSKKEIEKEERNIRT